MQTYREYLRIKTELKERCKEAYSKNWENKINQLSSNSKNSKQFWNKIKVLKEKKESHTNYMKDTEGNKYFSNKEKCNLMEKTWKDVFKITEEEQNKFDKHHSDHTDGYINVNHNRVNSYQAVDINRLNTVSYHTREISLEEMKTYIRRSKKKAPGSTKVNNQVLEKCTRKTLEQLKISLAHVYLLAILQVYLKKQLLNLYLIRKQSYKSYKLPPYIIT